MEDSESKKRIDETTGETPLDTVDHDRLARLVSATPAEAARSPWEQGEPLAPTEAARVAAPVPSVSYQTSAAPPQAAPVAVAYRKSSATPVILALLGLGLLLLLAGGIYLLTRSKAPTATPNVNNSNQRANSNRSGPSMKPDLVAIPGGTFQMGRADGMPQEAPPHAVTVGAFYIDRTEVTNKEYAQFIEETGQPAPSHFVNGRPQAGQEQWPVMNVSLEDARAFAAWRSKRDGVTYRLPTEEEWEYAARNGDQNNLYPWGDSWELNRAATRDAMPTSLKAVGSLPDGKNKWGVLDLIGNVWEWTSSKASYYQGSKQVAPEQKDWNIIRGGSIASDPRGDKPISAAYRDWIKPTTTNPYLGFRLVRSGEK